MQTIYKVSRSAINDILRGKNWGELTSLYEEQYLEKFGVANG